MTTAHTPEPVALTSAEVADLVRPGQQAAAALTRSAAHTRTRTAALLVRRMFPTAAVLVFDVEDTGEGTVVKSLLIRDAAGDLLWFSDYVAGSPYFDTHADVTAWLASGKAQPSHPVGMDTITQEMACACDLTLALTPIVDFFPPSGDTFENYPAPLALHVSEQMAAASPHADGLGKAVINPKPSPTP